MACLKQAGLWRGQKICPMPLRMAHKLRWLLGLVCDYRTWVGLFLNGLCAQASEQWALRKKPWQKAWFLTPPENPAQPIKSSCIAV